MFLYKRSLTQRYGRVFDAAESPNGPPEQKYACRPAKGKKIQKGQLVPFLDHEIQKSSDTSSEPSADSLIAHHPHTSFDAAEFPHRASEREFECGSAVTKKKDPRGLFKDLLEN